MTAYKEYDYPEPGDDVIITISLSQLYAFNSNGSQLWQRDFNPNTEINWFVYSIFVHNNTAFLFANNTSYVNRLVKVDINNNQTINVNTGIQNGVNDVQLSPDNNLIIASRLGYKISKVNLSGSLIWTQLYATNLPSNVSGDEITSFIQDSSGSIYLTGRHYGLNYGTPSYTNADILTIKYDSNGNLIWQNRYQYGVDNADIGNAIKLKNGQIYIAGQSQRLGVATDYDYVILKIDSATGLSTGVYRYNGLANGDDAVYALSIFDNGNVALTGLSYINSQYGWTTQLLSDVTLSVQNINLKNNFQVFPNPTSSGESLTILGKGIKSYSIISSIGKVVQQAALGINDLNTIQLDNISAGLYLLYLNTDNEITTRKIIVR